MVDNQNVDPQEIAKFEKMAATWWDLNGEFKPLHKLNPLRLNYIDQTVGGLFGKKLSTWAVVAEFYQKAWRE